MADIEVLSDIIITKYKTAGEISNTVLAEVIALCVADAQIIDICTAGDKSIMDKTAKVFNKKQKTKNAEGKEENKVPIKGIGFPTCLSVNARVQSYSPLPVDTPLEVLAAGDVVKIELGVHVDGYISKVAHTIVVGGGAADAKADVIVAAHTAAEAALRLIAIGNQNSIVTETVTQVAKEFGVNAVEGQLSHTYQRNNAAVADKTIVQAPTDAQRNHERWEFENGQVVAFEVTMSTGTGKPKETDVRTTVYRKTDIVYQLKLQSARKTFSEIKKHFSVMPFSLRNCPDQSSARMGIVQCAKAGLVDAYKVETDKDEKALVAKFAFTVLVTERGPIKLSGLPLAADVVSGKKVESEDLVNLLKQSVSRKSKKNKKRAQELKDDKAE